MTWNDRIATAERTGRFTPDDHKAVFNPRLCLWGERVKPEQERLQVTLPDTRVYYLFDKIYHFSRAVAADDVPEARSIFDYVNKELEESLENTRLSV